MNGGEEVAGQFIEALREAAQVFHAAEEAFDQIAFAVELFIIGLRCSRIGPVWNDRDGAIIGDRLPVGRTVIGLVGTNGEWRHRVVQKLWQDRPVMGFATRQDEVEWSSQSIDHGMELRRAAAA